MNQTDRLIEEIKILLQSKDLSDGPQLHRLYDRGMDIFSKLNEALDQCQTLRDNGAMTEASRLNYSYEPSLVRVAEMLDCPECRQFFDICRDYGLEYPRYPDKGLLDILSAPVSSGDKHLHSLLQDYRKIARNGSKQERIDLLRKIVEKLPNSRRWLNDLLSAERGRLQEIEQSLARLPSDENELKTLEGFYRELNAPELRVSPKPELLEKIKKRLLPLQKSRLSGEINDKLRQMQDCCMERDFARLRELFDSWHTFCSNPAVRLSPEQQQAVRDMEKLLTVQEEESRKEREFQQLVRRIERKLADNCTFAQVAGDYNQLRLQDHDLPENLLQRLEVLEEDSRRHEHFRNVRRCVYGGGGALFIIVLVIGAVLLTQQHLAVKHNFNNMSNFIAEGKLEEAVAVYKDLKKSSPRVAADARLIALCNEAEQKIRENKEEKAFRIQEFSRLLRQIKNLASADDLFDNSRNLDHFMESARKIMQDQPQKALDEFRELETAIARRRTQLKQKREKLFFDFCRTTRQEADKIITTISGKELFSVRAAFEGLKNRFADRMQQSPFMPEHIRSREKKDWDLVCKRFEAALKKETILQQLQKPASFDSYIATLEKSRYDEPAVGMIYQRALVAKDLWVRECRNYRAFIPEKSDIADASAKFNDGFFKQDLARIVPESRRSAGLRDFFSQIRKLSKLREIVFSTSAGEDYFFYTEKEIVLERLSRPRRLNISFEDMEKGAFYTFKLDFAAQKDPFVPVNVPKDLSYKMPEKFAALCGQTTLDSKFEVPFWPGRMFAEKFHALGSDGPGICENLQQALVWVSGADNITNPFLKEMFTLRLLEALCACSPFFTEGKEALARLKDQYVQRQSNWRSPQSQPSRKQETEQVNELLAQLDLARIVEARKLRADFLCAFHARKLVPAGVVKELSGEKVQISYFLKKVPVEMMVMDQQGLVLLSPALRQGIAAGEDRRHLFQGQVLWTFGDDMRTVDFVRKWTGEARKLNIELGVKPRIFPGGLTIGGIR